MNIYLKIVLWLIGIFCAILISGFATYKLYVVPKLEISPSKNKLKSSVGFNQIIVDSIYKYTNSNIRNSNQLSIAIIVNGSVFYYGLQRVNNELSNIDNKESLFQIGSISKVFTATILADMIVKNEINPDETIDKYLGFELKNNLKIRIKDLANHTSGLDRLHKENVISIFKKFDNPYIEYSDTWMMNYLKKEVEIIEKNKGISNYSNFGAAILGNVLSISKKSNYENLLLKSILNKYKMTNTFVYNDIHKEKLVKSYDIDDSLTTNWILNAYSPAGGIVSNIQDMAKFGMAQFDTNNKELTLTQVPTNRIDSNMQIGLGWFIINSKINHKILFHNGATGNFTSSMMLDMDSKKGVIILSSTTYSDSKGNIDKLSASILKCLNKK